MHAVWLFAGGALQVRAAQDIKKRGYKLILTDKDISCCCFKYADEFIQLDIFDIDGNLKVARLLKSKYKIKAVVTVAADCHETVARAAESLRLPGIDPVLAHNCRFKLKTREILMRADISQPDFSEISNINDASKAIKKMGLPVVLKSSNNSGSRGFTKIEHLDDLDQSAIDRAKEAGTTGYAILEKLVVPLGGTIAEQSVETLWYEGKMYWLNWVDRLFRKDFLLLDSFESNIYGDIPWGIELGHINPALHPSDIKKEVFDIIYKAGIAIDMHSQRGGHILKADIMLTEKGPFVLELTPRLSGGWDSSGTTPARGADFIGGAISLALGEKLSLELWFNYFQYRNPELFASILALINKDAKDCIGRMFAESSDFNRTKAVIMAYNNLMEGRYVSVE